MCRIEEERRDIDFWVGPPPVKRQTSSIEERDIPNELSEEHHGDILLNVKFSTKV